MTLRPPISTRTYTLFPYTTLCRSVDAERALLHRAAVAVELPRAVGAGPGAELAADAEVFVDEDDAVLRPLVGGAGRADGGAGRFLAVQAGFRAVDGTAAAARLDCTRLARTRIARPLPARPRLARARLARSDEPTSELQSLM